MIFSKLNINFSGGVSNYIPPPPLQQTVPTPLPTTITTAENCSQSSSQAWAPLLPQTTVPTDNGGGYATTIGQQNQMVASAKTTAVYSNSGFQQPLPSWNQQEQQQSPAHPDAVDATVLKAGGIAGGSTSDGGGGGNNIAAADGFSGRHWPNWRRCPRPSGGSGSLNGERSIGEESGDPPAAANYGGRGKPWKKRWTSGQGSGGEGRGRRKDLSSAVDSHRAQ